MIYQEYTPNGNLSKYISKLWYCHAAHFVNKTVAIPCLFHELIFNFSDNYTITQTKNRIENPVSWINGIQTMPYKVDSFGKHEMLGVVFKADGLRRFTKYAAADFTNVFVDAALVFDSSLCDLLSDLTKNDEILHKFQLVERFLMQQFNQTHTPQYIAASMSKLAHFSDEKAKIKHIANESGITHKSLINAFQKHIGLTPSKFLQLTQVNKALTRLSTHPKQSLTQLAYDLNYFDQAHFIHAFKNLTGLTPLYYATQVLEKKTDVQQPNYISLVG